MTTVTSKGNAPLWLSYGNARNPVPREFFYSHRQFKGALSRTLYTWRSHDEKTGMTQPLISTVIISRPQEPHLARAILSALWQEGPAFEVVLVLDGRCAQNRRTVAMFQDARLRVFEHATSLGRGAARKRAIEEARGAWIANVDADDWIFPQKHVRQWAYLAEHPAVDLLSSGLLIVDRTGRACGVRSQALVGRGLPKGALPLLYTPSLMVRASLARCVSFDARCRAGEDRDFLYRALPHATWASMDDPLYVYDEYASHTLDRCLSSYGRRVVLAHRYGGPFSLGVSVVKNATKAALATAAFAVGAGDRLVQRRSSPLSKAEAMRYQHHLEQMNVALARLGARVTHGADDEG